MKKRIMIRGHQKMKNSTLFFLLLGGGFLIGVLYWVYVFVTKAQPGF
jgi:hypothetical protein